MEENSENFDTLPVDSDDVGASLPTAEEVRTSMQMGERGASSQRLAEQQNAMQGQDVVYGSEDATVPAVTSPTTATTTTNFGGVPWRVRLIELFLALFMIVMILIVFVVIQPHKDGDNNNVVTITDPGTTAPTFPGMPVTPSQPVGSPSPPTFEDPPPFNNSPSPPGTPPATPPTPAPRKASVEDVMEYFALQQISTEADMSLEDSPQNLAVTWLAKADEANLPIPVGNVNTQEGYAYLARYVMALAWYSMGGSTWTYDLRFGERFSICSWNSYTLDSTGLNQKGVLCSGGVPVFLILYANNLRGTIPKEMGHLSTLVLLDLQSNSLTGQIPAELCKLNRLRAITVGYNDLTGQIPDCSGSWTDASLLFYANSFFSGTFPSGLARLPKLTDFYIDDNFLEGNINMFNEMTAIENFFIEDNYFSGTLDAQFMANAIHLTKLDMSNTSITSVEGIPTHLFNLPNITFLELSRNNLVGTIPTDIQINEKLELFHIYDNSMSGTLPTQLANLRGLVHLDVSNNQFVGPMPTVLGFLPKLKSLFLSDNDFETGPIPFNSIPTLEELSIKRTNRKGGLPTEFSTMTNLIMLDLDNNSFSGLIPESWGELRNLEYLLLNRNSGLNGAVPASFGNLTNLRAVFLDGTALTGSLDVLCGLPTFNEALGDYDGDETIIADCGGNGAPIYCGCAACRCCNPGESFCSNPSVTNLNSIWERTGGRFIFDFGENLTYIDRSYLRNWG